jgi:glycerol-3-phosphate acyltransferase PlsY
MIILAIILTVLTGYLLGSCNSAIITVRILEHKDIRDFGSHNAGLTNTLRCFGKKCALFTLIGDLAKGIIAVLISKLLCCLIGFADSINSDNIIFIGYIAGISAIIGHVFPLYHHFKGGKGVLVGVSVFVVIDWKAFLIMIAIFAIIVALSKYVSLGSIIAAASCPFVTFILQYFVSQIALETCILDTILAAVMGGMVIFMHRSNIKRLMSGTENKLSVGKSKK